MSVTSQIAGRGLGMNMPTSHPSGYPCRYFGNPPMPFSKWDDHLGMTAFGALEPSSRVRLNAYSCPRLWKNASYDGDDGDAFLGADGGGVGRRTGACGLSEAIRP